MQYPVAAAVAQDGKIYVADTGTPAIWKVKDGKVEMYFEASRSSAHRSIARAAWQSIRTENCWLATVQRERSTVLMMPANQCH